MTRLLAARRRTARIIPAVAIVGLAAVMTSTTPRAAADKRIVVIAGRASHAPGEHEFKAGSMLLQKALSGVAGVKVDVYTNGWPSKVVDGATVDDNAALDGADAVLIYADGGGGHPAIQRDHLSVLTALAAKGAGLGFAHYGVEIPVGPGAEAFKTWIGGYYETNYSVNPMWGPAFAKLPTHPVTRGVQPFTAEKDEWYFNMRWSVDPAIKAKTTPILVSTPTDAVRDGPYVSPRGPYPHVQADKGKAETMMWVTERTDGGRGFGFTGGHTHTHWGEVNQRRIVLNALLWIAKVDVPRTGVIDKITPEDLTMNLDVKRR